MEDVEGRIEERGVVIARRKTEREEKGKFWSECAAAALQPLTPCRGTTKEKK